MTVHTPTKDTVNAFYIEFYLNDEVGYKPLNDLLSDVVEQYPSHVKWQDVLIKASLINTLYKTNIRDIRKIANHIVTCQPGESIVSGNRAAVGAIASGHGVRSR
jgi:hypothetical protein